MKQCIQYSISTANDTSWVDRYISKRNMDDIMADGLHPFSSYNTTSFDYLACDHTSECLSGMNIISEHYTSFDDFEEYDQGYLPLSSMSDYRFVNGFKNYNIIHRLRNNFYAICEDSMYNY